MIDGSVSAFQLGLRISIYLSILAPWIGLVNQPHAEAGYRRVERLLVSSVWSGTWASTRRACAHKGGAPHRTDVQLQQFWKERTGCRIRSKLKATDGGLFRYPRKNLFFSMKSLVIEHRWKQHAIAIGTQK